MPETPVRRHVGRTAVLTDAFCIHVPSAGGAQYESGLRKIRSHVPHKEVTNMDGGVKPLGKCGVFLSPNDGIGAYE